MRNVLMTVGLAAWLLWAYDGASQAWWILGHFTTEAVCAQTSVNLGPGASGGTYVTCYPVGVDPTKVHPLYPVVMGEITVGGR